MVHCHSQRVLRDRHQSSLRRRASDEPAPHHPHAARELVGSRAGGVNSTAVVRRVGRKLRMPKSGMTTSSVQLEVDPMELEADRPARYPHDGWQ